MDRGGATVQEQNEVKYSVQICTRYEMKEFLKIIMPVLGHLIDKPENAGKFKPFRTMHNAHQFQSVSLVLCTASKGLIFY